MHQAVFAGALRDRRVSSVSLAPWQAILERHRGLFDQLDARASIGIAGFGDDTMVVCRSIEGGGWRASTERFLGVGKVAVDLLVVLDQQAARKVEDGAENDMLSVLRRNVRLGRAICYCRSSHETLMELGFAEMMDELGMAEMARSH